MVPLQGEQAQSLVRKLRSCKVAKKKKKFCLMVQLCSCGGWVGVIIPNENVCTFFLAKVWKKKTISIQHCDSFYEGVVKRRYTKVRQHGCIMLNSSVPMEAKEKNSVLYCLHGAVFLVLVGVSHEKLHCYSRVEKHLHVPTVGHGNKWSLLWGHLIFVCIKIMLNLLLKGA